MDGLHVIGTQHPAEVVMQLKIRRRARRRRLIHRPNDVRTNRTTIKHTPNQTYRTAESEITLQMQSFGQTLLCHIFTLAAEIIND